jgi:arylsulfatase A-like enzyme
MLLSRSPKFVVAAIVALVGSSTLAPASYGAAATAAAAKRPNIVVIVADDLGYHDVGFQGGNAHAPTPNIDSIAANGVTFTNGYVTGAVCSPTRAGLVTGRYQQRFGHEFNPGPGRQPDGTTFGLPLTERTIANELKDVGYTTANVGKWHLGNDEAYRPTSRGFDEWYGFLAGAHPYIQSENTAPIFRNNKEVEAPEHLTLAFGEEAAAFIKKQSKAKPYFLYLTFNAVHTPLQPDKANAEKLAAIANPKARNYAALLSGLDQAIGNVLKAVRESGEENNTLIFFVSDNGGPQAGNGSNNAPLRGDKATVLEGGIRVPFAVQWKDRLPAGVKYDKPVISLDITATAAAAGGAKLGSSGRPIDGVDLLPYLLGKNTDAPHEALFWRAGPQFAVRQGDYKLLKLADGEEQLYNLTDDIGEAKNLAKSQPDKVAELKATYATWDQQTVEPLWKRAGQRGQRRNRRARQAQTTEASPRNTPVATPAS